MTITRTPSKCSITADTKVAARASPPTETVVVRQKSEPHSGIKRNDKAEEENRIMSAIPPDGGWAWVIAVSVCMANFLTSGHHKAAGMYLPPLIQLMNSSPSKVAWIPSLQIGTSNLTSILASMLSQLISPRAVVIIGSFVVCCGFAVSSLAQSLTLLYFTFGICGGIGMSFTFNPAIQMVGQYFLRRRGIANGICMGGNAFGAMVIPLVISTLLDEYSFRGTILIMGALMFNTCVCAMLWHPVHWHQRTCSKRPNPEGKIQTSGDNNPTPTLARSESGVMLVDYKYPAGWRRWSHSCQSAVGNQSSDKPEGCYSSQQKSDKVLDDNQKANSGPAIPDSLKRRLLDPSLILEPMFWIIATNQICTLVAYPATQLFLPYRVLQLGYTQADAAVLLSSLAIADLFGRLIISWLSDFGLFSRSYWFAAGMATSGLMSMILPDCTTIPTLTGVVVAFGFSSGAYVGLFPSRISDVFGGNRVSMVAGLVNLFSFPFSLTGSPMLGLILEKSGSYRACQFTAGLVLVAGGLICLLEPVLKRRSKNTIFVVNQ